MFVLDELSKGVCMGGSTLEIIVSLFVNQPTPDIQKDFSKHAPARQGQGRDEIVSVATFVFNGRKDHKEKLRNNASSLASSHSP